MFFDDEDERFLNPEILHVVHSELYAITSSFDISPFYGLRNVPTHTEDGIPIRKLYVSNLPPKTTRTELFNVFAQYGFIKSCWLRMGDRGPNKTPTPTYAFVTFSNPADAHKALQAPHHEKMLRGRNLRISPADSWHQPAEDANGRVCWKPRSLPSGHEVEDSSPASNNIDSQGGPSVETFSNYGEANCSNQITIFQENTSKTEYSYNILDILNRDCMIHILTFVPIKDLIRSERVSKAWQNMIQEYLQSIRTFKTSSWMHEQSRLTTAVLRRVLQRLGESLLRLHIDHQLSALNDRTAHTIGKFCPNLEELKVVGMYTKNWNPLLYGCKQLKNLSFVSCNKLTDSSLVHLMKKDSCIEILTVANNTHVTGLFLTGSDTPRMRSLSFYNCYSLQGTVLCAAIDTLPNLTSLKLDVCPIAMWKIIPMILKKVPRLEELSLSEYTSSECLSPHNTDAFCEAMAQMKELKILNLSRNIYISNAVMKQIGQTCTKLESLNISSCNSNKMYFNGPGVGDEGVRAVCIGCKALHTLDVSYLAALTDAGLCAAARLPLLYRLVTRGSDALSSAPLARVLRACHYLQEIDACGCDNVSLDLVDAAVEALELRPRPLLLRLAATAAASAAGDYQSHNQTVPNHKLLTVNLDQDLSNPNLRPDFVDHMFDYSSDDSLDDLYDRDLYEDYEDFIGPDDEIILDQDDDDLDGIYAYGIHAANIILL